MGIEDIADKIRGDSSSSNSLGEADTVSKESSSGRNRADMDDFYRLLLALGEMQMYGHVANKSLDQEGGKKAKVMSETVDDITGNTVEFIGSFDVMKLADRHGIDWQDDVLDRVAEGDVIRK